MPHQPCPSIAASFLHRISSADALALVDQCLGRPAAWHSPLVAYRLTSDFQSDWKEEVGHWLNGAQQYGFLDALLNRSLTAANQPSGPADIDPNDWRHLRLMQELAPAMLVHYLTGTKWAFGAWEPSSGQGLDVDVLLTAPSGSTINFQVKASDQYGNRANGRIVDGEYDERVLTALGNACTQLPADGLCPNLIVMCAQRVSPLSQYVGAMVTELIGRTLQVGDRVVLQREKVGKFYSPDWSHISGVVFLDLVRGVVPHYACTVLLNPTARVAASPDWFLSARVCEFDGHAYRWIRGEPGIDHTLPDGTELIESV